MTDQEFIGRRIATVRRLRHMKQVDLGAAIGVTDQTISNWEVGLRTPRSDLLSKLCQELRCSADYLLGLTNDPPAYEGDPAENGDTRDIQM
ncbi:MAG: helix-turn-helix transcriptional regulator [Atopobiaceae bacterium]|nr:helix-turn-helix transcriptional regulator [Atopobiaceae bacterium]